MHGSLLQIISFTSRKGFFVSFPESLYASGFLKSPSTHLMNFQILKDPLNSTLALLASVELDYDAPCLFFFCICSELLKIGALSHVVVTTIVILVVCYCVYYDY